MQRLNHHFWILLIMGLASLGLALESRAANEGIYISTQPYNKIMKVSKNIDDYIDKMLKQKKMKPFKKVSDEVFMRRVYLDIIGRIPTHDEAQIFLKKKGSKKRFELIDSLLNSEGYVSNSFTYWADLLRIKTSVSSNISGIPYVAWLKKALRRNYSYDEMVRELLTAKGDVWAKNNGATGYYLRDFGMVEDNMANTVQVFLGTRLACAQCHDHPFDKWTRKEFYEMTAFTKGTRTQRGMPKEVREKIEAKKLPLDVFRAVKRYIANVGASVVDNNEPVIRLPKDYQYDNAKPNQLISAKTIFDNPVIVAKGKGSRLTYARWMTSKTNLLFTKVFANRMWKRVMGLGLIEPVDDMKDNSKASHPELMTFLTEEVIRQAYDIKDFLKILYNTNLYQRESLPTDRSQEEIYYFQGPIRKRMTAEQIWDSLITLVVPNVDHKLGYANDTQMFANYKLMKKNPEKLIALALEEEKKRQKIRDINRKITEMWRQFKELREAKKEEPANKLRKEIDALRKKRGELQQKRDRKVKKSSDGGSDASSVKRQQGDTPAHLVRASELKSPMIPGHLLRQFGQSDRELVENAGTSATTTQILNLYNGFIDHEILNPRSQMIKRLQSISNYNEKIKYIFISILSREPNKKEKSFFEADLKKDGHKGYGDLIWALLNTHEFMFVE